MNMNEKIENLLKEERKFPPSKELTDCLLYTSPSPRDSR